MRKPEPSRLRLYSAMMEMVPLRFVRRDWSSPGEVGAVDVVFGVLDLLEKGQHRFRRAFLAVFADLGFFGFADEDADGLEGGG